MLHSHITEQTKKIIYKEKTEIPVNIFIFISKRYFPAEGAVAQTKLHSVALSDITSNQWA